MKSIGIFLFSMAVLLGGVTNAVGQTMTRQYQFEPNETGLELVLHEVAVPALEPTSVLVKIHAVSLNRRDLTMLDREDPSDVEQLAGIVPISDGAGEVIAVGSQVTEFKAGDRVMTTFFENWVSGELTLEARATVRGNPVDGVLSEWVVSPENGLLKIPQHLSYAEASTLPCAALTAWNGLFKYGALEKDQYVLLEGTGGVSVFGLQFAEIAGAKPIITSSSDQKLERAKDLGAYGTVNYRQHPDWDQQVRAISNDEGVNAVLEVIGEATIAKAFTSLAPNGHIAIIGGLSGSRSSEYTPEMIQAQGYRATQFLVGSREDFEQMNAFIVDHQMHPVVDREFAFEQASEAFTYMRDSNHFGKIVIRMN
ncbi:MAG: NAD(P)-dependent alcohol dehydrogenase [Proteobacteria bacterium]|jgi:NADPH:quinone reductase-like Zn-dependent oxidoreductase|nr:NAD(P)-dependent alcohol dehydrogenase [Pseudomonadota bacterium]